MQHPSLRGEQPYGPLFSMALWGKKGEGFKPSATVPAYFYNPQPHPRDSSKKLKEGLCPQAGAVSKLQYAN